MSRIANFWKSLFLSQRSNDNVPRPVDDETIVIEPGMSVAQAVRAATQSANHRLTVPTGRRGNWVTRW